MNVKKNKINYLKCTIFTIFFSMIVLKIVWDKERKQEMHIAFATTLNMYSNGKIEELMYPLSVYVKDEILKSSYQENVKEYCYLRKYMSKNFKNAIIKYGFIKNKHEKEDFIKSFDRLINKCHLK